MCEIFAKTAFFPHSKVAKCGATTCLLIWQQLLFIHDTPDVQLRPGLKMPSTATGCQPQTKKITFKLDPTSCGPETTSAYLCIAACKQSVVLTLKITVTLTWKCRLLQELG